MSRYFSYLNSAVKILSQYCGKEPFAIFLRTFFSANKKYGSRDRKKIAHLCYCYFRLGKLEFSASIEDRILTGLFLCSAQPDEILTALKPEWAEKTGLSLDEKFLLLDGGSSITDVFPWKDELSEDVDYEAFCTSFFVQPYLFLRLRPGKEDSVKHRLQKENIPFETLSDFCLFLPNTTKIDTVLDVNKEAIIQDYSSQKIAGLLALVEGGRPSKVWDCCAGSGGKSMMAYDLNSNIKLTVSDVRESILINLKRRFKEAGIRNYTSFRVDLTQPPKNIQNAPFDLVIADTPCTGSGTWSRTPEQLCYFDADKIEEYSALQQKIITHLTTHIKPGGYLLYITCSVFKKENEEVVDFIKEEFPLQEIRRELIKGYDKKADTMFASLFKKMV